MNYEMKKPCSECPFLASSNFKLTRLIAFSSGQFPCHKTAELADIDDEGDAYHPRRDGKSQHCAGALIFLEKRNHPHQMMRIMERLGKYDRTQLDMTVEVK